MRKRAIGISIGLFITLIVGMGLSVRWVAAARGGSIMLFGGIEAYGSQLFLKERAFYDLILRVLKMGP